MQKECVWPPFGSDPRASPPYMERSGLGDLANDPAHVNIRKKLQLQQQVDGFDLSYKSLQQNFTRLGD
jgi:hypothetical protein